MSERATDFPFRAIGTIRTPHERPDGMPIQGRFAEEITGRVELDPELVEGLADLDGFSHLVLLYAFHRADGHRLTVTPYMDTTPRGLFATRAPRRPNPIGMTIVRLLRIEGNVLHIGGADMLDGTPLLDIKPFVPVFDQPEHVRFGWIQARVEAERDGAEVRRVSDDRFHTS